MIHDRNLKYILKLGFKLTKIHRVLQFEQNAWLKHYIDMNTKFRKYAKHEFAKDFIKLMNNTVFGKTMENVKNRMQLHLTTNNDNAIKWFSKVNFKYCKYHRGLYMIEMFKQEIVYDKPIYVRICILGLSK